MGYIGGDVPPLYRKRHNPFAYVSDVLTKLEHSAVQISCPSPSSGDLGSGSLPNFGFIVPNTQDDGHDCPGEATTCVDSAKLAAADAWLKSNIDPLINSAGFGNSVLIITWDESALSDIANGGGQVAAILVGSHVKTGFRSTTFFITLEHTATRTGFIAGQRSS